MGIAMASSVIIHQVDIEGLALLKTKDEAPISGDSKAPEPG
jgi:hypothetical protein